MDNKDKYGYDNIKNAFDERKEMDQAKNIDDSRFNYKNPRDTSPFEMERAPRDTSPFYIVNTEESFEVKEKEVSEDKKMSTFKKSMIACAVAVGVTIGTIVPVDIIMNPAVYDSTHEKYIETAQEYKEKGVENPRSISEIIKRTPSNFGIGGK